MSLARCSCWSLRSEVVTVFPCVRMLQLILRRQKPSRTWLGNERYLKTARWNRLSALDLQLIPLILFVLPTTLLDLLWLLTEFLTYMISSENQLNTIPFRKTKPSNKSHLRNDLARSTTSEYFNKSLISFPNSSSSVKMAFRRKIGNNWLARRTGYLVWIFSKT